ncbi:Cyanovirin-N [Melanomma pulvis-pyrius CBS 109.77]|uniref:Cyanovirin-N n=1 Tax=Melanomma pulvis-pyrius CBS 109.77 TaxID=1314802 RepID=A0A6A6X6C5_9PLEO|nr:Cyanovirin-N [Melanomma pulvis-pyrius CBS 109.77]
MIFKTAFFSLASLALVVNAVPAIVPRAEPGLISADCIDVFLRGSWLVGSCLTGEGTTRVQSSVYLSSKITNREGTISWKIAGGYGASCKDCKIINGSSLNCQCYVTGRASTRNTTLNLDEHIHNYRGHLLTDQFGTPVVPPTSTVPVPTDFSWTLSMGASNCFSDRPDYDISFCRSTTNNTTQPCNSYNDVESYDAPVQCFAWRMPISTPIWMEFEKMRANAPSKAIEFLVYDNMDCNGEPFDSVKPGEYGTCKLFPQAARGVRTKMLWNADSS